MFWEEKIDQLKKLFAPADFHVPFTDGSSILKKIEARFVISAKPAYQRTNWAEQLKAPIVICTLEKDDFFSAISALNRATNYWVVVVFGEASMAERFVYDCRPVAMGRLTGMAPGDYYIGDKKYGWLVYFNVDRVANTVTLIKSGTALTPFEQH